MISCENVGFILGGLLLIGILILYFSTRRPRCNRCKSKMTPIYNKIPDLELPEIVGYECPTCGNSIS